MANPRLSRLRRFRSEYKGRKITLELKIVEETCVNDIPCKHIAVESKVKFSMTWVDELTTRHNSGEGELRSSRFPSVTYVRNNRWTLYPTEYWNLDNSIKSGPCHQATNFGQEFVENKSDRTEWSQKVIVMSSKGRSLSERNDIPRTYLRIKKN